MKLLISFVHLQVLRLLRGEVPSTVELSPTKSKTSEKSEKFTPKGGAV